MTTNTDTRKLCDQIITRAAEAMVYEVGVDIETCLDRLLTYSAAQAVHATGSAETAAMFRVMADRIEAGIFAKVERDGKPAH